MKAKLTKSFVDKLEPDPDPKKRLTVWDTELSGFGVTMTPYGPRGGGVKSYIVQYRTGGKYSKIRRIVIGHHGAEWAPQAAREEAAEILRLRRRGLDPFEERRRTREGETAAREKADRDAEQARRFLFSTFAEEFIEEYAKKNQPRSWENTRRALGDLGRQLEKQEGRIRVDLLAREQIEKALKVIAVRSPSAAIEARKAIRKMYTWANDKTIIAWHPARSLDSPAKEVIRDRVLSGKELKVIYLASQKLGYPFGDLYALILFTGLRLREAAEATWGEYSDAREALTIPSERMKRKPSDERGAFLMPLNIGALATIESIREQLVGEDEMPPSSQPIFAGRGMRPIAGFSTKKKELDALVTEINGAPLPRWTTHDLRRTMSTVLQPLGVSQKIIDRLQDHRDHEISKTARHYQHWDYFNEKQAAARLYYQYLCGVLFDEDRYRDLVLKVEFRLSETRF